jgi:hypothetical protein
MGRIGFADRIEFAHPVRRRRILFILTVIVRDTGQAYFSGLTFLGSSRAAASALRWAVFLALSCERSSH